MKPHSSVLVALLARGLVDLWDKSREEASPVRQDAWLPPTARRALSLLSAEAVLSGASSDPGASVHDFMEMATRSIGSWELSGLVSPFPHADVVLVDADGGVPTEDCRELANAGGSEIAAVEELQFEKLRSAVSGYPARRRDAAYTEIREFVVRHPVTSYEGLVRFVSGGGHAAAAATIMSFYRRIPRAALFPEGRARLCGQCGSLLMPDRDAAFAEGRCRLRDCRLAFPEPERGADLEDPETWRVATPSSLAFWVGPGLAETRVHDALLAKGVASRLYPMQDAADIGIDGLDIGVDVKSYASPVLLGARLSRSIGRMTLFARRILVVPDHRLRNNPLYLEQLRSAYVGPVDLEFTTVSHLVRSI